MNDNIRVAPSKFVCIKLPTWANLVGAQKMYKDRSLFGTPLTDDPNTLVAKMLQNYVENCLQYSYQSRTDGTLKTPTESYFWKMLRSLGALSLKETKVVSINNQSHSVYAEDSSVLTNYNSIVKYVGDINVLNHVKREGQSYTEIYMHIPTSSGYIDNATFVTNSVTYETSSIPATGGATKVVGLEAYDNANNIAIYDTIDKKYEVSDDLNSAGLYFDDFLTPVNANQGTFDFNAVLVYYDIWNSKDATTKRRNLHGILFLDNFSSSVGGGYDLKAFTKYQPDTTNAGNSYGFRLNLKFSNSTNQTTTETVVNDYSTASMLLYMEALEGLVNVTELYTQQLQKTVALETEVSNLKQKLSTIISADEATTRLRKLEDAVYSNVQTPRISYEDIFTLLSNVKNTIASDSRNINIQQIIGQITYNATTGLPIVTSPNGSKWTWDSANSKWVTYTA
jgi:hypothetical protein